MISTETFVDKQSIVRKIWSNSDVVLFIFAGAAAEFALNKAVDWLYFTGKLPADPLGRLFSTIGYAHRIIFAHKEEAHKAIDNINAIHKAVEESRGQKIPEWAYRDVIYMLIHYSVHSFELLERKLTQQEKDEVYNVFYRMGTRMSLQAMPQSYTSWLGDRSGHMKRDLVYSRYTPDLFLQYKKHLGLIRYNLMLQVQALLLPAHCKRLLKVKGNDFFPIVISSYKIAKKVNLQRMVQWAILPPAYRQQLMSIYKSNH